MISLDTPLTPTHSPFALRVIGVRRRYQRTDILRKSGDCGANKEFTNELVGYKISQSVKIVGIASGNTVEVMLLLCEPS